MLLRTSDDEATRNRDSREFELDCKCKSANYLKRVTECKKDLDKECTFLCGRHRLNLCDRIEAQSGFDATIRKKSQLSVASY